MARKKVAGDQNPSEVEDLNAFINKLFDELIETNGIAPGPGDSYRFEISVNKDGVTITPNATNAKGQVQAQKVEEKEPLIDVIEKKDGLAVIAELPGIEKKKLEIHADHERLSIKADKGNTVYSKLVPLPSKVDPSSAVAIYNNGILEITFKRSNTYRSIVKIDVK
jgi:HSP20 family protein